MIKKLQRIKNFMIEDLWRVDARNISRLKGFLLHQLKVIYLIWKGFIKGTIHLQAAWLTYMTLLCVGPFLAFIFSLAKNFGVQDKLRPLIIDKFAVGQGEVFSRILEYVDKTNVATLGTIGLVILIAVVINMLGFIERAFNDIWGIKRSRNLFQKFRDYISVGIIFPILVLAATGITASYSNLSFLAKIKNIFIVTGVFKLFLSLAPYVTLWLAFAFVYIFLPNTRVRFRSALIGGIVGGTLWQVAQWLYVHFQVGVARYSAIYGIFASFPIFLIWVNVNWIIILFGAEVSFAYQNATTYREESRVFRVSQSFKEALGLRLVAAVAKKFNQGEKPWSAEGLSQYLNIPVRLINEVLFELCQGKILAEVKGEEINYQPAKPIEKILLKEVLEVLRTYGDSSFNLKDDQAKKYLQKLLKDADEAAANSLKMQNFKDFISRL